MFKALFVLLSAFLLVNACTLDDLKARFHCGQGCCGCPLDKAKSRVKRLTNTFINFLIDDSFPRASELLLEDAILTIKLRCNDDSCCERVVPLDSSVALLWNNSSPEVFNESATLLRDGTVIVSADAIFYVGKVTYVFKLQFVWVPTEGCNYKLANLIMVDARCPCLEYPTTSCSIDCTISSAFPTITVTTTVIPTITS